MSGRRNWEEPFQAEREQGVGGSGILRNWKSSVQQENRGGG